MNNPDEHRRSPRAERTAETLRDQLELEFVAIHQRRAWNRQVARVSVVATLVCVAAFGMWCAANFWPGRSNPSDRLAQAVNAERTSTETGEGKQAPSPEATTGPNYSAIKVIDLSDDEVRSLLATTKSNWFVAEIDGKPTAFPLEPSSRTPTPASSLN